MGSPGRKPDDEVEGRNKKQSSVRNGLLLSYLQIFSLELIQFNLNHETCT